MRIPFKGIIPAANRRLLTLRGPLRGGKFYASPRASMRKVLGVYEHELNPWLYNAVDRVGALLDVGAADGYFAFGCAAAFERAGKAGKIFCFEPQAHYCDLLDRSAALCRRAGIDVSVVQKLVGNGSGHDMIPLSSIAQASVGNDVRALIKIDVEGAEVEVLRSAGHWLAPRNIFLVEVHAESLIEPVTDILNTNGISVTIIDQSPHWLLGREHRDPDNRWIVSAL
jgi:hypothetical protein